MDGEKWGAIDGTIEFRRDPVRDRVLCAMSSRSITVTAGHYSHRGRMAPENGIAQADERQISRASPFYSRRK
jgi:hypothetical protein